MELVKLDASWSRHHNYRKKENGHLMNRVTYLLITFVLNLQGLKLPFSQGSPKESKMEKCSYIIVSCGIQKYKLQVVQQAQEDMEVQTMVHECIQKHIFHDVNKYNSFIGWFRSPHSWKHKYKTEKTINCACHKTINQ